MKMADSARPEHADRSAHCAWHCVLRSTPPLGELFRNFAQKLRRTFFRFRRGFLLHKTLHAREFFVNAFSKVFKVFDALYPRELFVDAPAKLFEFVHACLVPGKIAVPGRTAATWVL